MTPKVKRYAVITFLVAWWGLPGCAFLLNELSEPWFQIACVAVLAFIVAWVWLMVRAIREG